MLNFHVHPQRIKNKMLRTVITIILPLLRQQFCICFGDFLSWRMIRKNRVGKALSWHLPWVTLVFSGAFLMAISLIVTGLWSVPYERGRLYVSPFLQDGKVVPGHFESAGFLILTSEILKGDIVKMPKKNRESLTYDVMSAPNFMGHQLDLSWLKGLFCKIFYHFWKVIMVSTVGWWMRA